MVRGLVPLVVAVLCLAACGSSKHAAATTTVAAKGKTPCRATARSLARLQSDIREMRVAARKPTKDTLVGNHDVNTATDRFLHDVAVAPIDNLRRNRLIDHAMGSLAGSCEQCVQALEAERPVINIRLGQKGC